MKRTHEQFSRLLIKAMAWDNVASVNARVATYLVIEYLENLEEARYDGGQPYGKRIPTVNAIVHILKRSPKFEVCQSGNGWYTLK